MSEEVNHPEGTFSIANSFLSATPIFNFSLDVGVLSGLGEVLSDKKNNGKERPWSLLKADSLMMAYFLQLLGNEKKGERVSQCGTYLWFKECLSGHEKKLLLAYFCKDRFCVMCMWRKSLMMSAQLFKIAHIALDQNPTYRFLFLTLTIPNVEANNLSEGVTTLLEGWNRLMMRTEVKKVIKGSFRAVEVTYNVQCNTWHPHIHALLFVPAGYFKKHYIKHERWLELWKESTRIPTISQVNIKAIQHGENTHEKLASIVSEVSKYSLKPPTSRKDRTNHPYIRGSESESIEAVEQLIKGLKGRRLVQFGGIFKDIKKELGLKDENEADLIHVDEEETTLCNCSVCGETLIEHLYAWNNSQKNYVG